MHLARASNETGVGKRQKCRFFLSVNRYNSSALTARYATVAVVGLSSVVSLPSSVVCLVVMFGKLWNAIRKLASMILLPRSDPPKTLPVDIFGFQIRNMCRC